MAKAPQQPLSRQQRKSRQIDKEAHRRFQLMVMQMRQWPLRRRLAVAWKIVWGR